MTHRDQFYKEARLVKRRDAKDRRMKRRAKEKARWLDGDSFDANLASLQLINSERR